MMAASAWARRRGPEVALALMTTVIFLGFLGKVDLWGKREQRASAEALDTIDSKHWLVAQIQGRPRLEKPPLPRWTIATLITVTGLRNEAIIRLPSALSGVAIVGLVYGLGRRLGGRSVGLASGLALLSMGFFVTELRQAGNDGPLAFFTTLALYAVWRRLHGEAPPEEAPETGGRVWNLVFYGALGLGFLTKGPIIVLLVALTLIPYLASAGRIRSGARLLADGRGLLLFAVLALSWPVPVMIHDPNAVRVWLLEMGQKAGMAGISHHRAHHPLALDWFWLTAPWIVLGINGVLLPFLPRGKARRPSVWFPWWWSVGNLAMFCGWSVAKPNYFLPCSPGVALLVGMEWVALTRLARSIEPGAWRARRVLQSHWVFFFVAGVVAPVIVWQAAPQFFAWVSAFAVVATAAVAASAWAWRRGADAGALAPMVAAWAIGSLIGYGVIAPSYNEVRSHRVLAATLDRLLPPEAHTVMFYQELDEGLWFYLRDRTLLPVPGSQPRYNKGFDFEDESQKHGRARDLAQRLEEEKTQFLISWIKSPERPTPFVLIRGKEYDRIAGRLAGLATLVYREENLMRHGLVLLRLDPPASPIAARPGGTAPR